MSEVLYGLFIATPFLIPMLFLGALIGFVYRRLLKLGLKRKQSKTFIAKRNIGRLDRVVRFVLAAVLLLIGSYFLRPSLLVAAGFVFYEAAASWCALYSALGRNTCPM